MKKKRHEKSKEEKRTSSGRSLLATRPAGVLTCLCPNVVPTSLACQKERKKRKKKKKKNPSRCVSCPRPSLSLALLRYATTHATHPRLRLQPRLLNACVLATCKPRQ
ncbi:uncharacterized protein K452DRAFT_84662 [Aplosporella prunicola CBS 121167]|uniref:Uncharacterized protein n=1 Tax=Aplosporella prunicola CBS 121167 TaxID=1176127 RepID=A0A6A6B5U2_9PEZI|nr:uncharacterized protein K452DRAFT_84662 [Aplosporella prunicola CBS 121167]KAF2138793.1 hypothetical protein K452DRAFT_84662 [Aplosporella prunicola CBS 121167]